MDEPDIEVYVFHYNTVQDLDTDIGYVGLRNWGATRAASKLTTSSVAGRGGTQIVEFGWRPNFVYQLRFYD
ncbi:hypothetical protein N7499_004158 [Penicillium canescens]|uniref:Uncharacterized protein n=1 Tax=Penicillium canescens TaxID=5083 RepID=A0AAD6N7N0_PENCN|nr:uncharacterized protein N7446_012144 [Penicillium canescens]XP_058366398.1 uncharacterized protein N7446_012290 [Penicillium canescens]KAJ6019941.1 hypothetical protein N7522_000016 [Penicillium canescens]KAJ6020073.1 hypothetical protein N7522_000148 [Penicillium canescens]KAJ6037862.1 hypothetical protein N7460_007633 [Penicillium canescens]KAJ6045280.1 hypothetical protein N7446_012144 [Penicillium canescens]KAJ6045426.1 hypothetical protein N7446_012290 [Penicillium canescens]